VDPWDVPEPKTLETLPKTPGRRAKPVQRPQKPFETPSEDAGDAPDLHSLPTEGTTSAFNSGFEVITTPPPARERSRTGLGDDITEEVFHDLPPPPPTTEEIEAPTEFESSFFDEDPSPAPVTEQERPAAKKGLGALIVWGGLSGLVVAAIVFGGVYWAVLNDDTPKVVEPPADAMTTVPADQVVVPPAAVPPQELDSAEGTQAAIDALPEEADEPIQVLSTDRVEDPTPKKATVITEERVEPARAKSTDIEPVVIDPTLVAPAPVVLPPDVVTPKEEVVAPETKDEGVEENPWGPMQP